MRDEIPPGTLDMLILKSLLANAEMHGFEIVESIRQASEDVLQVEEGSLYPSLQRMLRKGWVRAEWGRTQENRRARYYRLTAQGRKQVDREMEQYQRVARAIALILKPS